MNWFRNLAVARKLAVAFSFTALITLSLGGFALARMQSSAHLLREIGTVWAPAVQQLSEMRALLGEFRTYELAQLAHADDPKAVQNYFERMDKARADVATAQDAYAKTTTAGRETELYDEVKLKLSDYYKANAALSAAVRAGDLVTANRVSDEQSRPARRDLFAKLVELTKFNVAHMDSEIAQAEATYRRSVHVMLVAMALFVLLAAFSGWFIARSIAGPLGRATRVASAIAQGKLDNAIHVDSRDEAATKPGNCCTAWKACSDNCRPCSQRNRKWPSATMPAKSAIAWNTMRFQATTAPWCATPTAWSARISRSR